MNPARRLTDAEAASVLARAKPIPVDRGASPILVQPILGQVISGSQVTISPGEAEGFTLLLFASASCHGCHELLMAARNPAEFGLDSELDRALVIVRDSGDLGSIQELSTEATCVASVATFDNYGVTGTPFFSLVDPSLETVATEGVAWGVDTVRSAVAAARAGHRSVEIPRLTPKEVL